MKKLLFFIPLIALSIFLSTYFYYSSLVDEAEVKKELSIEDMKKELLASASQSVASNNLVLFEKIVKNLQNRTSLQNVNIKLKKYFFSDELLLKSVASIDESWNILEISIDAMQGTIAYMPDGRYEILTNDKNSVPANIAIKFEVEKNSIIKEFLYIYETQKEIKTDKSRAELKSLSYEENDFTLTFEYGDISINKEDIADKTRLFLLNILFITISVFILFVLIYNYLIRPKFRKTIESLNEYIKNILDGRVIKEISIPKEFSNEFELLNQNIQNLSKKNFSLSSELSISKDIIYQKEKTDELTGLPNKKSFENDIKYMFIANKNGFIIQLKIDKIGEFTNNHGPELVDSLIEEFSYLIKNFLDTNPKYDGTIYRFFGAEFAMIVYDVTSQEIEDMLIEIIEITKKLSYKYYFFENEIYYGATPFDNYGTIESILQSAKDTYENAIKEKSKHYYIADEKNQQELNKKLEQSVKEIIARRDFVLQYIYDTYDFNSSPKLLMQEVSALIVDSLTLECIPSRKFLSVAKKLGYIMDFDKALIEKVLFEIELGKFTHKICIALSSTSLSNQLFLSWLEEFLKTTPYRKNLIFVAPSYSVASNYDKFVSFCTFLRNNELEFMIKQYHISDLELQKLLKLSPSYLRLERAYCQDFKRDSSKQHIVKQILLFCDENGIKVLGDSLKNEQDYLAFEMLGFYGTSR
ncbi:MAG: EAL domain-containing protein [Sulfurimonas sp.]|uniref:EAL domain-containing protein n=1 Tax=Sulfurimonas sp. TaxID=2022749 RepID=UPI002602E39A|nr:EAL domain-containing protein [Sulfurimonas sp.]MDD3476497.1 EAL domain-containing protein [Sulfurimonas sp.]